MKRFGFILCGAMLAAVASAAVTFTTEKLPWDLYKGSTIIVQDLQTEDDCIAASVAQPEPAAGKTQKYSCRTRTNITVTGVAEPPPPADSDGDGIPDSSDACPNDPAPGTPDGCPTTNPPPPPSTGALFTDLTSAPSGAEVTAYLFNAFPAAGQQRITVLGHYTQDGADHTLGGYVINVPLRAGAVKHATPANLRTTWAAVQPGDVVQLAAGNYTGFYGEATWTVDSQLDTFVQGTAALPIALIPEPGASVTFTSTQGHANMVFGDGNGGKARYITVAGLKFVCRYECVSAGGDTSTDKKPESGGEYVRLVGNTFTLTDKSANTMTGLVSIQGDGWQILGNAFHDDPGRAVINNNHVVYIQNGADDVEVAYNELVNLHVGFVVQIHQDGSPMLYERLNVHDNYLEASAYANMRGVTTSNIQTASTVTFAHNVMRHLGGGGWGCINVYSGQVTLTANDCADTQNGVNVNGDTSNSRKITMDSNKLCPASGYVRINYENGASASQVTETNPVACN